MASKHNTLFFRLASWARSLKACLCVGNKVKMFQLFCGLRLILPRNTGYVWKDKSSDGVRQILECGALPLDRLLVETDAPFMYPNTRASKLPQRVKEALTPRSEPAAHDGR